MKLNLFRGRGVVTAARMTVDGEVVHESVSDPRHRTGPVPLGEYVAGQGGVSPLPNAPAGARPGDPDEGRLRR